MNSPANLCSLSSATTCLAILIASLPPRSYAQEDAVASHKFTLGTYYSTGTYGGEESTDIFYLPLSYEISHFPWVLSVTLPYLQLQGPGDVFLDTGNVGRDPGAATDMIDAGGLGDAFVSASYQFPAIFNDVFVDLSLQAKLPTADEKQDLGTGKLDYGPQLDFYSTRGRNTYFSTLGYRFRGKTPLYDLKDSAFASVGLMRQFGEKTWLGLAYDYREKASTNSFATHEVMPFVSYNLDDSWNLMVYTIAGFTDSSADRTVGLQLSFTLP